jgi:hypothetical protein
MPVLSTCVPLELLELLKEKAEAITDCGIKGVTFSSLAVSFLEGCMDDIASIDPEELADDVGDLPPARLDEKTCHLAMAASEELVGLLKEKVAAIKKCGVKHLSLSSLTASFLMGQLDNIERLDPDKMAADMVLAGAEPVPPGEAGEESEDEKKPAGDSEGGDSDEGQEAEGPQEEKDSPGKDEGEEEDDEDGEPAGEADKDGDEEVSEPDPEGA